MFDLKTYYADLGQQIRNMREAQQMTQSELAARCGTIQAYISNVEAGKTRPSAYRVYQIIHVLQDGGNKHV